MSKVSSKQIKFKQFIEQLDEAMMVLTLEGEIISWNRCAEELYGYSSNEIVGLPVSVLSHSSTKPDIQNALFAIRAGKYIPVLNSVHHRKDGSPIHVMLIITPLKGEVGDIDAISVIVHDITESQQAQDLLEALMNNSPVGIFILQRGFFQYVSQQFLSIMGYSKEEMLKTVALDYVHPEDREKVNAKAIEALKTGYCVPYEYRVLTKSGEVKWIMETVVSVSYKDHRAVLGNFMDVTELRNTQTKMHETNEKLNSLVKKLERQNQMNSILSEMRDLLQACSTIKETAPIIVGAITKLFPKTDGALFLMSPSRTDLEPVAKWGNFPQDIGENVFAPDDCWGLRRGRPHAVLDLNTSTFCSHVKDKTILYTCLPLSAKGDMLGLLHIRIGASTTEEEKQALITDLQDLTENLSEFIALALANIKLSESLQNQSIRDPLSGLFNRRYMEETLQREIQRAIRRQSSIGIVMADIDHFKRFNDTYGHAAGDICISQVGQMFQEQIRASDVACRYGGEEFVLIFPESSIDDTFKRADTLRQAIKEMKLVFQGQSIGPITISMGVAAYPVHGANMDDLLRGADDSLYKAKQEGRDRVVVKD